MHHRVTIEIFSSKIVKFQSPISGRMSTFPFYIALVNMPIIPAVTGTLVATRTSLLSLLLAPVLLGTSAHLSAARCFHSSPIAHLKVLSLKRANFLDRKKEIEFNMRKNALQRELADIKNGSFSLPDGISQDFFLAERQFEMQFMDGLKTIQDIVSLLPLVKTEKDAEYFQQEYLQMQRSTKKPVKLDAATSTMIYQRLDEINATQSLEQMIEYFDTYFMTTTPQDAVLLSKVRVQKGVYSVPENINVDLFHEIQALKWDIGRNKRTANDLMTTVQKEGMIASLNDANYLMTELPEIFICGDQLTWSPLENMPVLMNLLLKKIKAEDAVLKMLERPIEYQTHVSSPLLTQLFDHFKQQALSSENKEHYYNQMERIFVMFLKNDMLPSNAMFADMVSVGTRIGTATTKRIAQKKMNECTALGIALSA